MLRRRVASFLTVLAAAVAVAHATATPAISFEKLAASPSSAAVAPAISVGPDGVTWLSWVETEGTRASLRIARWDAAARTWSASQLVASGSNWVVNGLDTPSVTVGAGGNGAAAWLTQAPADAPGSSEHAPAAPTNSSAPGSPSASAAESGGHSPAGHASPATGDRARATQTAPAAAAGGHAAQHGRSTAPAQARTDAPTRALVSRTSDGGKTWSAPVPLTRESNAVEFVALATLADGRVLAAWLDGRGRSRDGRAQLRARIVGSDEPDALVDASVCDCCSLALTAFPDGTALLAYRARRDGEIRDILTARFESDRWSASGPMPADGWRIAGCPVNGPHLAIDGGRVASVWFTAAGDDPRTVLSFSSDAGSRFLNPLRLSEGKSAGRTGVALLHDGAILATWVDPAGVLWLRRVSPDFVAGEPLALTSATDGRVRGIPRLTLIRDYAGGAVPAEALVVFNREGAAGLTTLRITLPESELIEAERNCDCTPTADQLQGFALRGTLAGVMPDRIRVEHAALPGLLPAGVHEFRVEPDRMSATDAGRPMLARIERRDGAWWLYNVRFIAAAPR